MRISDWSSDVCSSDLVAFLMGDSGKPHGSNYAVFDNWIHEPCYLMGVLAGTLSKTGKIGMVGGHAIGEVNRLFHAFMEGARSVNPDAQFKVAFIGSWFDPPKAKEFALAQARSAEHTSELQSLMRIS